MKIVEKGFLNPRPEDHEKRIFDPNTAKFLESENVVNGFEGRQFTLLNSQGELVGNLLLTADAPDDSWIKIRVFGVEKPYIGSGAVDFIYDKSFQVAKEYNKDLVMDCVATVGAYKSFVKYLRNHNYRYEENPLNQFQENTKTYQAPNHSYTILIKKENFI